MTQWQHRTSMPGFLLLMAAGMLGLTGCGSSGGLVNSANQGAAVNNTQSISVNSGPENKGLNELFTDVTLCSPGTTTCQTISNVRVDTGASGLRILSSQVSVSLTATLDTSGNPLQECISYADGSYIWGPVETADVQLAGEKASKVPIQVISQSPSIAPPGDCTGGGGSNINSLAALGANGVLGVGPNRQDCGVSCSGASANPVNWYFLCPNASCSAVSVDVSTQLQNPVWLFSRDNNGLKISLPSVTSDGEVSAAGSMVFGVSSQSDNAIGSAKIITTDSVGDFETVYNGVAYNSFLSTGYSAYFFLDASTLGIPYCTTHPEFYCPSSPTNFSMTAVGYNNVQTAATFTVANEDVILGINNGNNTAFNDLGGPSSGVIWGTPFFYGHDVFIGIEGQAGPNGSTGPYYAF